MRANPRWSALALAACTAPAAAPPPEHPKPPPAPIVHHLDDPDMQPPPKKLLAIDWGSAKADTDDSAAWLWKQISPYGDDWEEKLGEIPGDLPVARQLAVALLRQGNFACQPPPALHCARVAADLEAPGDTAGLDDPCLRRLLAMWAVAQLEPDDLPKVHDALLAIVAIPPPESQLVSLAIDAIPQDDQDARLELAATAWRAGHHDLVNGKLSGFDEQHLISAAIDHHIDGTITMLPAEHYRGPFLHAITDPLMSTAARDQAMLEVVGAGDKLPADIHEALVTAAKGTDCTVAATAARVLDQHGDHKLVPKLPATRSPDVMMRALCVLASFEQQSRPDEASYLPGYVPASGVEVVLTRYESSSTIMKPNEFALPELDDLVRAMRHCAGTTCTSDDHEFIFSFAPTGGRLLLSRLEVKDRPPCQ
jgi:hypothetical protein